MKLQLKLVRYKGILSSGSIDALKPNVLIYGDAALCLLRESSFVLVICFHFVLKIDFFRALPKLPLSLPPPIRASCTTFFGRQKRRLVYFTEPSNDD